MNANTELLACYATVDGFDTHAAYPTAGRSLCGVPLPGLRKRRGRGQHVPPTCHVCRDTAGNYELIDDSAPDVWFPALMAQGEQINPLALATPDRDLELPMADYECRHGRLPGDRSDPCGCFDLPGMPEALFDRVLEEAANEPIVRIVEDLSVRAAAAAAKEPEQDYCPHGYPNFGSGCPDCDTPAWTPTVLDGGEPDEEQDATDGVAWMDAYLARHAGPTEGAS